jgi:hypothetical protein
LRLTRCELFYGSAGFLFLCWQGLLLWGLFDCCLIKEKGKRFISPALLVLWFWFVLGVVFLFCFA